MKRIITYLLLLFVVSVQTYGQKKLPKLSPADFSTPYEAADTAVDAVYICEIGESRFNVTTNGFVLETTKKTRIHILTEKGKDYADNSVLYYHDIHKSHDDHDVVKNVEAAAYNLVDGKVVKTNMPGKYVFKEQVNDRYMRLKFSIPDVRVGTIIEYSYTVTSPRYTEIPSWYIQHKDPVRYSYYSLVIPKWINCNLEQRGYKPFKVERTPGTMAVSTPDGPVVLETFKTEIEASDVEPFKDENFIYCKADYQQRVEFEVVDVNIPGGAYYNFTSTWNDVRKYLYKYGNYRENLNIKNPYGTDMSTLALGGKPVSVKASMIYALLKSKLKWDKTYQLVCDNPLKAVKTGKGSNAELNFIYMAMLRDAGIKATPLMMRWRSNGHLPLTFPSIDRLNTFVVAIADDNGALLFADCSSDYGDVNVLPVDMLADGVLYDPELPTAPASRPVRGEIYDLSAIAGNYSSARLDCSFTPDGQIAGQRIYTHVGINAMVFKESYHEHEDSVDIVQAKEKGLDCRINSYKVKNVEGPGRMAEERIRFVKDVVKDGDKLYFNPLVFPDEKKDYFVQEERLFPVEFPTLQTTKISTNLVIPDGYAIEEMPQNQAFSLGGYLSAVISFEKKDNVLVTNYESNVHSTLIPVNKYADLREFWSKLLNINSMMVCLKKL